MTGPNLSAPCQGCPLRDVWCHSTCEAYQLYAAERRKIYEDKARQRASDPDREHDPNRMKRLRAILKLRSRRK